MLDKRFYLLVLIAFLSFSACIEVPTTTAKKDLVFFDLKEFFNNEVNNLERIKSVKKSVEINGVVEELVIDSLNFEEEFSVFLASDINRIAWIDKYKVDSLISNNQLQSISYSALDEKLKTQSLIISYTNNKVDQVTIKNIRTSLVSDSEQDLEYKVGKGYNIVSRQNTSMTEERLLKVAVEFQ